MEYVTKSINAVGDFMVRDFIAIGGGLATFWVAQYYGILPGSTWMDFMQTALAIFGGFIVTKQVMAMMAPDDADHGQSTLSTS